MSKKQSVSKQCSQSETLDVDAHSMHKRVDDQQTLSWIDVGGTAASTVASQGNLNIHSAISHSIGNCIGQCSLMHFIESWEKQSTFKRFKFGDVNVFHSHRLDAGHLAQRSTSPNHPVPCHHGKSSAVKEPVTFYLRNTMAGRTARFLS